MSEMSPLFIRSSRAFDDTTLEEMAARLAAERGVRVVWTAVWKFLDRHDQTHKKRPRTPPSKAALT